MPKRKEEESSVLNVAQASFFRIAQKIGKSVKANQAAFEQFMPFYTKQYVDDYIKRVDEVEKMPTKLTDNPSALPERAKLVGKADAAILNWEKLARSIARSWTNETEYDNQWAKAGGKLLVKARRNNWEAVTNLLLDGSKFLTSFDAAMIEKKAMAATFPAEYEATRKAFDDQLVEYDQDKEKRNDPIKARNDAITALYKDTMAICEDGQVLFANDPDKLRLFIYDDVRRAVLGTKPAGIKGLVLDNMGRPLQNARIYIQELEREAFTDENGRFELLQVAAGTYQMLISLDGYKSVSLEREVKTQVVGRIKVVLEKVAEQ